MIDADSIARARSVRIAHEIHRRGLKLRRQGRELVGPCPVCGGRDRFAVHTVKNTFVCRRCPAGGGVVDLVMHLDGVPFADAVAILTDGRRVAEPVHRDLPPVPPAPTDEEAHRWAMRIWRDAVPIAGTIAEHYLTVTRGLVLPADVSPRVLRFHAACPFGQGIRHPCLVALYRDVATDEPRAIMRTALTTDARKIERKALGPVGGAAIKLTDDAEVTMSLTIGEGLETTLAGLMLGFSPAWALGFDGAIRAFPALAGVESLTILTETGDGGANARATRECARRWLAAGRDVFTASPAIGADMADTLTAA